MNNFVSISEFENAALDELPKYARDYYKSGATTERTLADNKNAFSRLRILPKFLKDISQMDTSTTVLGQKVNVPFGVSPTAMQKMAHPEGEMANARAVGSLGTIFILSTLSTSSIEDVAEAAPETIKWFQLYIYKDRNVTKNLVFRAEKANFKAIVLTVDAPYFGLRRADVKNKFSLPSHLKLANFEGYLSNKINDSVSGSGINDYVSSLFDSSVTWKDVKWLKSITKLPIIIKGIMRTDDAKLAVESGASAIIVSNHGARQIDDTPATIEILPEIIEVLKGTSVEVYLDGGVSQGTDVLKALALGAKMVFVGRPALWGLANGGQKGVEKVLNILKIEFESAMGIAGCSKVSDITRDLIKHQSAYSKL